MDGYSDQVKKLSSHWLFSLSSRCFAGESGIRFLWNKVASCRKSFFGFHHDAVVRQVLEECARHYILMHFFLTEQFNAFIFCFRSNLWLVLVVLYYLEYSLDLFKAIAIFALVCLTLWYGIRLLLTTGWGKQARCFRELLFVIYLIKWSFRSLSNRVGSDHSITVLLIN